MKLTRKQLFLVTALIFAFGAFAGVFAQDDDEAGGYVGVANDDRTVVAAARFAVKTKSPSGALSLVSIDKAQMQVVAGTNYRLCLTVKDSDGTERLIVSVVFQSLQKVFRLSSWEEKDCSDE